MSNHKNISKKCARQLTIDRASVALYTPAHGILIPLHAYDAQSARHGHVRKDGKRPIHNDWTKRNYPSAARVIEICERDNLNVGVRLPADIVVIDIDPRNGGDEGWDNLTLELGLDESIFPCTITGSGGRHYWARKPAEVLVVDTLKDFSGVEFKSKGRQVVAAGSIHPETKEHYRWDDKAPAPDQIPDLPENLLRLITRPQRSAVTSGGQLDQEQAERVLSHLDPTNFRSHDRWLKLMMSVHHGTLGDARQEWIDWSISDPNYAHDAEQIGRRWDSLHTDKSDGPVVGYGTLRHFLSEAKALGVLPPDQEQAAEDFDGAEDPDFDMDDVEDDSWMDGPAQIKLGNVNADNIDSVFRLVNLSGKVRILYMGKSLIDKNIRVPEFWAEEDVQRALRNKFVKVESKSTKDGADQINVKRMPLAMHWLTRKDRPTYDGLIFDASPEESEQDEINLWRGFSVDEDSGGDWCLMRNHIRNIIASGDPASDDYILKWLAWAIQNPTKHCEVALVLLSELVGTGKGFLARAMCKLFGAHGLHISQRNHLVGHFNAHFAQVGLLFCDEVLWPGHKEDEGVLKAIITEPTMMVEAKGINAIRMPNALKIMMASNHKWAVPASSHERRYAVFEVSAARAQDHQYFGRIDAQLNSGGLGAMLHDLQAMELNGWHPRQDIPQTKALAQQKEISAAPLVKMLGDVLADGCLPGQHGKPNRAQASWFYDYVRKTAKSLQWLSDHELCDFLHGVGAVRKRSNGTVWDFPPLPQMRAAFREAHPYWPEFDNTIREWVSELDPD